jgi:hypothetical protein
VLLDPNGPLPILPGTRLLTESFSLVGVEFEDPKQDGRVWRIERLFAPIRGRALGGVRARVVDNKGFTSFVNQRDLELLLDVATPGSWCHWSGTYYPGLNDDKDGWYGLCCDAEDLRDQLQEYELWLRDYFSSTYQYTQLPSNLEYTRRVHVEDGKDVEELLLFLWDQDPETGLGPDGRYETIDRRWRSVEERRVVWDRVPVTVMNQQ